MSLWLEKEFTTRCKMLIIKTGRLEKTFLERACTVLEKSLWTDDFTRIMEREKYGGEKRVIIWSILHYLPNMVEAVLWLGYVWLLMEAAGWILKYTGLYTLLILHQMLKNWSDGASQLNRRIMQKKGGWCKSLQSISTRKIHDTWCPWFQDFTQSLTAKDFIQNIENNPCIL